MDVVMEHEPDISANLLPVLEKRRYTNRYFEQAGNSRTAHGIADHIIKYQGFLYLCTKWKMGSRKTFVLKMVERQLRDYQAGEKFAVFHYNCWEYDYYDEPLIAIVSSMLDSIRTLYNKNGLPYIGVDEYMKHRL